MEFTKNEPYEIEQWVDPQTDIVYIKIRKFTDKGKIGIVLSIISDECLYNVCEGCVYPRLPLERVR